MSATVSNNENPFNKGDRVAIKDKTLFLHKKRGIVLKTMETSVIIKLDNKIEVVIYFKKLRKLRKTK